MPDTNQDSVLEQISTLFDPEVGAPVTLSTPSGWVTGYMVTPERWQRAMLEFISQRVPEEHEVDEYFVKALRGDGDTSTNSGYIHLINTRLLAGLGVSGDLSPLRLRADAVTGWMLGTVSTVRDMRNEQEDEQSRPGEIW